MRCHALPCETQHLQSSTGAGMQSALSRSCTHFVQSVCVASALSMCVGPDSPVPQGFDSAVGRFVIGPAKATANGEKPKLKVSAL